MFNFEQILGEITKQNNDYSTNKKSTSFFIPRTPLG